MPVNKFIEEFNKAQESITSLTEINEDSKEEELNEKVEQLKAISIPEYKEIEESIEYSNHGQRQELFHSLVTTALERKNLLRNGEIKFTELAENKLELDENGNVILSTEEQKSNSPIIKFREVSNLRNSASNEIQLVIILPNTEISKDETSPQEDAENLVESLEETSPQEDTENPVTSYKNINSGNSTVFTINLEFDKDKFIEYSNLTLPQREATDYEPTIKLTSESDSSFTFSNLEEFNSTNNDPEEAESRLLGRLANIRRFLNPRDRSLPYYTAESLDNMYRAGKLSTKEYKKLIKQSTGIKFEKRISKEDLSSGEGRIIEKTLSNKKRDEIIKSLELDAEDLAKQLSKKIDTITETAKNEEYELKQKNLEIYENYNSVFNICFRNYMKSSDVLEMYLDVYDPKYTPHDFLKEYFSETASNHIIKLNPNITKYQISTILTTNYPFLKDPSLKLTDLNHKSLDKNNKESMTKFIEQFNQTSNNIQEQQSPTNKNALNSFLTNFFNENITPEYILENDTHLDKVNIEFNINGKISKIIIDTKSGQYYSEKLNDLKKYIQENYPYSALNRKIAEYINQREKRNRPVNKSQSSNKINSVRSSDRRSDKSDENIEIYLK